MGRSTGSLGTTSNHPSRLHPSLCLLSWSCGGQECLDGWLLVVPRDPVDIVEHLLFSTLLPEVALNPSKPLKTRQDCIRPYASSVGVVEDRSVLMTFLGVIIKQPIA